MCAQSERLPGHGRDPAAGAQRGDVPALSARHQTLGQTYVRAAAYVRPAAVAAARRRLSAMYDDVGAEWARQAVYAIFTLALFHICTLFHSYSFLHNFDSLLLSKVLCVLILVSGICFCSRKFSYRSCAQDNK